MAVFTSLSLAEASRILAAHQIGPAQRVHPIPAGSVNSNFFLDGPGERFFLRIYEEQGVAGVTYEWALLDHLLAGGVPVPRRVLGTAPGEVCVDGKPTALFECMAGEMICQAGVGIDQCEALGRALGRAHVVAVSFPMQRLGRFTLDALRLRCSNIDAPEDIADVVRELQEDLAQIALPTNLPSGVIHGDLFRDNVHWNHGDLVGIIDWESASHGLLAFDVMVTFLAWCFDSEYRWDLAAALIAGYQCERLFEVREKARLREIAILAALRFAVTRITDFHLRAGSVGERVHKDYRRFVTRLAALKAMSDQEFLSRLGV